VSGGPLKPLVRTAFNEGEARFSHDGRWIAYVSNESGQPEVYLQAFPLRGSRLVVSSGGGSSPQWRQDGREVYFQREGDLYAVDFSPDEQRLGVPHRLFADLLLPGLQRYVPSRNGQRFLAITPRVNDRAQDPRTTLNLILNWPELLSR
jgi:hypothetical protein